MSKMETNRVINGDSLEVLQELPANSVHAIVCDPPYGLAFMGRDWDDFEPKEYQEWCENWARRAKRVLKPGGHLLAFSGNRTHHRLFTGVEDAGYEIRDTLTWHYGSGFPKASDVSKTIDKRGGRVIKGIGPVIEEAREEKGLTTREVAEHFANEGQEATGCVWNWENGASNPTVDNFNTLVDVLDLPFDPIEPNEREVTGVSDQEAMTGEVYGTGAMEGGFEITEPASDLSEKWDGWKTGLKPATEYVVMARKPFDGATVDCVLEHGTGALNIGQTRIEGGERPNRDAGSKERPGDASSYDLGSAEAEGTTTEGRYPSNVVFDETQAAVLDAEVGDVDGCNPHTITDAGNRDVLNDGGLGETADRVEGYADSGGPSRYFYTSKASKAERTLDGRIDNAHPTVKPQDLMEWLVKLVTREGQIVLDPFAGSGTTLRACKDLSREFVGIERQAKWADVARVRVGLTPEDPSVVRSDDKQNGLEEYQ